MSSASCPWNLPVTGIPELSLRRKNWIMSHPVFKCLSPALWMPSLLVLFTLDSQICFPHLISCLPSLSSSHTGPRAALRWGRDKLFVALFGLYTNLLGLTFHTHISSWRISTQLCEGSCLCLAQTVNFFICNPQTFKTCFYKSSNWRVQIILYFVFHFSTSLPLDCQPLEDKRYILFILNSSFLNKIRNKWNAQEILCSLLKKRY